MSTDALPQQAQAAQATAAGETTPGGVSQTAPDVAERDTDLVAAPDQATSPEQTTVPEPATAPAQVTGSAQVAGAEQDKAPEQDETLEREENLETRTAARLHELVASGAEKLPGEAGSTVSRLAVALLSFGSQAATKDQDKPTTKLVGEAVELYRSLDDDDPAKQRAVLEGALEKFTTSVVGGKERSQVLEVAEEAMGLWAKLRGTSSDLAKSDAAVSMRSLSSVLRREGRDEEADETETEAKRLES